jgi:hypothetical protein
MPLREAAVKVDARVPGPKCGVARMRLMLDKADLEFFNALLKSDKTSVYVSEVLSADDKKLSDFSIARHRKRKCSCAE